MCLNLTKKEIIFFYIKSNRENLLKGLTLIAISVYYYYHKSKFIFIIEII